MTEPTFWEAWEASLDPVDKQKFGRYHQGLDETVYPIWYDYVESKSYLEAERLAYQRKRKFTKEAPDYRVFIQPDLFVDKDYLSLL